MAVETSPGSAAASPSANGVKSTGNLDVGSSVRQPGSGVHCHQCRQKIRDFAAVCKNKRKRPCMVKLCSKCLFNRYGEKADDVASLEEWICPKCRGICNCSVCMKRRGHQPIGPLSAAKATGFSSVSEMLLNGAEHLNHENGGTDVNASIENVGASIEEVAVSTRKRGKEDSLDGQLDSRVLKKPKKLKHCGLAETSNAIPKEIILPLGTDLTSVAGIDVPAEDVGNALEFLEFCSIFGKILEIKSGEAEYVLQDIFHGRSAKRGKHCPVVQFHMHLLTIIKTEQGEKFEKRSASNGKNSWFDALKECLAESQCILKAWGVDSLEKATDYEALNASEMLKVLNVLCIEILGTKKLRNWIDDQNTQHERMAKEARQNVLDARGKIKSLKQKIKDDDAKAVDSTDAEQEGIVSSTKSDAEQAHAELLESKAMLLKIDQNAHALRTEPIFMDDRGHMYWKLNVAGESEVLHQYVGKGDDTLTLNEKWSALSAEEKEAIEKNISTRRE